MEKVSNENLPLAPNQFQDRYIEYWFPWTVILVLLRVEITPKAQRLFCVVQIDLSIEFGHFLLIFITCIYIKDYYIDIVEKSVFLTGGSSYQMRRLSALQMRGFFSF